MAAWIDTPSSLTSAGADPMSVQVRHISAEIFPILGVRPAIGRVYTAAEDVDGGPLVAVISHDLWEQRFGGRSDVIG
jgi:hypothetical protein